MTEIVTGIRKTFRMKSLLFNLTFRSMKSANNNWKFVHDFSDIIHIAASAQYDLAARARDA